MTYSNPWESYSKPGVETLLKSIRFESKPSKRIQAPITHRAIFGNEGISCPRLMWIGHASVYLQLPSLSGPIGVLFDPIFSKRCSPIKWLGPKRRIDTPCQIEDLPFVHVCVISHDHYETTIRRIGKHHLSVRYLVPSGLKDILVRFGVSVDRIIELGWWENSSLLFSNTNEVIKDYIPDLGNDNQVLQTVEAAVVQPTRIRSRASSVSSTQTFVNEPVLRAICTPAQHNSGRSLFHRNKTLWCTWVLEWDVPGQPVFRVFFGGSYTEGPVCPIFQDVRDKIGKPHLSLLPIANGATLPYIQQIIPIPLDHVNLTRHIHCSAADAIDVHQVLGSGKSIGIHWGTFTTERGARNTRSDFLRARNETNMGDLEEENGFGVVSVGVWVEVPSGKKTDLSFEEFLSS